MYFWLLFYQLKKLTLPARQAFIDAAVLHETTVAKTLTVEDLKGGKGFASVHMTAVFLLASSAADVTAETVPETLSFDVRRIALVQHEFRRIVKGCAMLVLARFAIAGENAVLLPSQRDVLSKLATLIINGEDVAATLDDAALKQDIINPAPAMLQLM